MMYGCRHQMDKTSVHRCHLTGGLGDLNGLARLPTLPGPDLNLPDLNSTDMPDMQALRVCLLLESAAYPVKRS